VLQIKKNENFGKIRKEISAKITDILLSNITEKIPKMEKYV
jgi:hypothetical protein